MENAWQVLRNSFLEQSDQVCEITKGRAMHVTGIPGGIIRAQIGPDLLQGKNSRKLIESGKFGKMLINEDAYSGLQSKW